MSISGYKCLYLEMKCMCLLGVMNFITPENSFAQTYQFDHFSFSQGLSNSHITTIHQDSTGFVWIGTEDGLNRFDGYNFRVYRTIPDNSNTLPDNNILCTCNGKGDDFWVGTYTGVVKYLSSLDRFIRIPVQDSGDHTIDVQVHSLTDYQENGMLLGTNIGLFIYNKEKNAFL